MVSDDFPALRIDVSSSSSDGDDLGEEPLLKGDDWERGRVKDLGL